MSICCWERGEKDKIGKTVGRSRPPVPGGDWLSRLWLTITVLGMLIIAMQGTSHGPLAGLVFVAWAMRSRCHRRAEVVTVVNGHLEGAGRFANPAWCGEVCFLFEGGGTGVG